MTITFQDEVRRAARGVYWNNPHVGEAAGLQHYQWVNFCGGGSYRPTLEQWIRLGRRMGVEVPEALLDAWRAEQKAA